MSSARPLASIAYTFFAPACAQNTERIPENRGTNRLFKAQAPINLQLLF